MLRKVSISLVFILGFFVSDVLNAKDDKPKLFALDSYQGHKDIIGWLMSEKLDGIRAYWDGKELLTRNGNKIYAPKWFIKDFPEFELDGELWIKRDYFSQTQSIVLKMTPVKDWHQVKYYVFEVPNVEGGLLSRVQRLKQYLAINNVEHITPVNQQLISSHEQVQHELQRVIDLGGEGLVIRNPHTDYQTGRLKHALKVKLKQDAECIVRAYKEGKGRLQGKVGALVCELMPEQVQRLFPKLYVMNEKMNVNIGSGLTDQLRANPPAIGSTITFQYSGLTKSGLPRFPVFLRIRKQP